MIEERKKEEFIGIWCDKCNKILAELDEDTRRGWIISDCEHYKWEIVSVLCFYEYDTFTNECDPEFIKKLRSKYILRIDSGENFFLLIPKEGKI